MPTGIVDVVSRAGAARMRLAGSWPAWRRVQVRDDSGGGQRGWGAGLAVDAGFGPRGFAGHGLRHFPLAGQAIHPHLPTR
ncbi:MAG: hypothetical protein ACXVW7_15020, partial [Trebonia sp.]